MRLPKNADVVVIGGGIIGCAITYFLSRRGWEVVLLEKDNLLAGASGACDEGIVLSSKSSGIHLQLAQLSKNLYKKINKKFEEDLEYQESGGMILIKNKEQWPIMKDFVSQKQDSGLEIELLSGKNIFDLQPFLPHNILGAAYCKEDSQINPINTTLAFADHAQSKGAQIVENITVQNIELKDGKIEAVNTSRGRIGTERVINAAGAWAPQISNMVGLNIPIKPRQGQLLVSEQLPALVKGTLLDAEYITSKYNTNKKQQDLKIGFSLNQTQAGNLLIGGCRQFKGYDNNTSYKTIKKIVNNAVNLIPFLKNINIIRSFAGLRPYTPDGRPILGKIPGIKGFYMAAGHEGDGIALAPITGKIIADILESKELDIDQNIFNKKLSIKRFIS